MRYEEAWHLWREIDIDIRYKQGGHVELNDNAYHR